MAFVDVEYGTGGGTGITSVEYATGTPSANWTTLKVCAKTPKLLVGVLPYQNSSNTPMAYAYDFENQKKYRNYNYGIWADNSGQSEGQSFRLNGNTIEFMATHTEYRQSTQYIIFE